MAISKTILAAAFITFAAGGAAQAGYSSVVNLSANPLTANAGTNSPGYAYNPVVLSLAAGSYTVAVVGSSTAGATYDAYSVYAPILNNGAYTDAGWTVNTGTTYSSTGPRFNTAAASLAYYSALAPYSFTLASAQSVAFALEDTSFPSFLDDSGGVSLLVAAVPEPGSMMLLGAGLAAMAGMGIGMQRRRTRV